MDIKTTTPLIDLGQLRTEWQGIFSPRYDDELIEKYIHRQFLEEASTYAARYNNRAHWKNLISLVQKHSSLRTPRPTILDIGSGAGNSVFPLLDLFPDARVVATDLSVPLLRLLKGDLDRLYPDHECLVMQLNAEQLVFAAEQFDLVCGGAILHHLLRPEQTLLECHRVLKPGGAAVFFEPFELGNQVLAMALGHLLELNSLREDPQQRISAEVCDFLQAVRRDYDARKGRQKPAVLLEQLDDKHLFTKGHFEEIQRSAGFEGLTFVPISDAQEIFSAQAKVLLQLGMGRSETALPDWAWNHLRQLDDHFSADLRGELSFEFCVIFAK